MALQTIRFEPDRGAIAQLLHGRNGMVVTDLRKRAIKVQFAAVRQTGKRTGKLARSIHIETTLRPVAAAYIGSNVRYALLHHDGSRPHAIAAKPGRMLSFSSNGKRVMARMVLHPGTKPNRYLTDNLIKAVR